MDVVTRSETPGKSLPAELVVGGKYGGRRLMQNADVMQHRRLSGIGDMSASDWAALLQASTAASLPLLIAQNPGTYYTTNPQTGEVTVYAQPTGSNVTLPVGVVGGGYGGGGGVGVPGVGPGGAGGVIQTPVGTISGGMSGTTLMMLAMAGLVAVMMMRGR